MGSPGLSVTRITAIMLKHKLRKSRKNILSLLEFREEDEKRENVPEYSEIKKAGRKDKKKKDEVTFERKSKRSRSEVRAEKPEQRIKNVETQTSDESGGGLCYYMPVLVPCSMTRRSSPAEDYIWTLNGVKSLIEQQQQLLRLFGDSKTEKNVDDKISTRQPDNEGAVNDDSSRAVSLDKYKATSSLEIREDVATRSSSSIQTLRRILEIEELKKFSDKLHLKIEAKYPE